jgi:hypothetical protein
MFDRQYQAAFTQVEWPKDPIKFDLAQWEAAVRAAGVNIPVTAGAAGRPAPEYFLPLPNDNKWTNAASSYSAGGQLLTELVKVLARGHKPEHGLIAAYVQRLTPRSGAFGMRVSNQLFYSSQHYDIRMSMPHESGHTQGLRHSVVGFGSEIFTTCRVATIDGFERTGNSEWLDHDQNDAFPCLMSYQNARYDTAGAVLPAAEHPQHWHFCGCCLLHLRGYTRAKLRACGHVRGGFKWIFAQSQYHVIAVIGAGVRYAYGTCGNKGTITFRERPLPSKVIIYLGHSEGHIPHVTGATGAFKNYLSRDDIDEDLKSGAANGWFMGQADVNDDNRYELMPSAGATLPVGSSVVEFALFGKKSSFTLVIQ